MVAGTEPAGRLIIRGKDQTAFLTDALRAGVTLKIMGAALGVSPEWVRECLRRAGLRSQARHLGRVRALHHAFLVRGYHPAQQVVADWCVRRGVRVRVVPTKRDYSCAVLHVGPTRTRVCCHMVTSASQFSPSSPRYFYAATCKRSAPYACYVVSPDRIYCLPRWVVRQYRSKVYFPELSDGLWEWTRLERAFLVDPALATRAAQVTAWNRARDEWVHYQRRKTQCPAGHPLSGDNLYVSAAGHRGCRACRAEASRRAHRRH
jgi:hypothetical protein